jgi:hypothetical protein
MQWWNDFLDWLNSPEGARLLATTVIPFIAIVVAGVVAALIARGTISRLFAKQERAQRASAVEALIAVGEKASQWSGLAGQTRDHFEAQTSVASIRVRLLPSSGAAMASAWAEYQLAEIKRNSANFSVQADQGYAEYRDRLVEWHHRPSRARKLFAGDLERFRLDSANDDTELIERQRRWAAEQSSAPTSQATSFPSPVTPAARTEAPRTEAARTENVSSSERSRPLVAPAAGTPAAETAAPVAPLVPAASTRAFTPGSSTQRSDDRELPEVVEARIVDDSRPAPEPEKTRLV